MYPSYLKLYNNGQLEKTAEKSFNMLKSCCICPHKCKVNRFKNELGFCKTGLLAKTFSYMPHLGEEPPISGEHGSGTIFFSNCNMACIYCQNYEFSQLGQGKEVTPDEIANFMLELQKSGCHNINLVTPTHVLPQIIKSLCIAVEKGLHIPIVYNTSGYELPGMIKILNGIVDIYLADMRYAEPDISMKYSSAPDYPKYNQESIKEMHSQVGIAAINNAGIIEQGLIIRHLVLPNNLSGTTKIFEFISKEVSTDTYISLMSQYLPYYNAKQSKEISRRLTYQEYENAKSIMESCGLHNGWVQESFGLERFAGVNIKQNLK